MKKKRIEFLLDGEEFTIFENNWKLKKFKNQTDYIKYLIKEDSKISKKYIDINEVTKFNNALNMQTEHIEMLNDSLINMYETINKSNKLSLQNYQNNFASSKMIQIILAHLVTFFKKENIKVTKEAIDFTVEFIEKKHEDFKKNLEK